MRCLLVSGMKACVRFSTLSYTMPSRAWHNVPMGQIDFPEQQSPFMTSLHLDLKTVEAGVPVATMAEFVAASGMQAKDIYEVVIPARTLKHRKARKEPLTSHESDKLVRLIRVYDQAVRVLGEKERALYWLSEPKRRFEGRTPIHMLRTDLGGRMVEEMLGQIYYGMFA
jgi:putative toxin-antitoxin system antitoxin component (TIGR02293 family)